MSEKDLSLKGLSKWRYRELKYFCLQYPEWKEKLNSSTLLKAVTIDGMPKSNTVGNITERQVLNRVSLEEKCKIVEQAAIEADVGIYQHLLKNVTLGISYEYLTVPCGRRRFYEARRKFFNILDKKGNKYPLLL